MNARARMSERATLERDVAYEREASPGHRALPDWRTLSTNVPCRLWSDAGAGEQVAVDRTTVALAWRMLVPVDVDVLERDRVNGVVRRDGTVYDRGVLTVSQVIRRRSHLLLILDRIR